MITLSQRVRAYGLFFATPVACFVAGMMVERPLNLLLVWIMGMLAFGGFILFLNGLFVPILRQALRSWNIVLFLPIVIAGPMVFASLGYINQTPQESLQVYRTLSFSLIALGGFVLFYMQHILEAALDRMDDTTNGAA